MSNIGLVAKILILFRLYTK